MSSLPLIASLLTYSLADASPPPAEYVAKLTSSAPTAEAQFKLAEWARRQGMKEVAEGHLRAAAYIHPNFAQAQKALGRTQQAGRWESKEERQIRLGLAAAQEANRVAWMQRLGNDGVATTAAQLPMSDGGAAALEAFATKDESRSLAAVNAFSASSHGAATIALLKQAVGSEFPTVRRAAVLALAERNPDHVLPPLTEFVKAQPGGKSIVVGVGEVWTWQEGATQFVALPAAAAPRIPTAASATAAIGPEEGRAHVEFVRDNAVAALRTLTGKSIGNDYTAWRNVVMATTSSHLDPGPTAPTQRIETYYQGDETSVGTRTDLPSIPTPHSCFAAGTPVVAKRCVIPIDQICVGELVLSRNVETGETAYKPVLARTLRPRTPMTKLTVGRESLLATAGHPFWTGDGWAKVKDLKPNAPLAAEDSRLNLTKIESAEPLQAYNLIVADFATYFVGQSHLLVHDNSPVRDAPVKSELKSSPSTKHLEIAQ